MSTLTMNDFFLVMIILVFVLGAITFISGVLILTLRASGREIQSLATQTTRLAQKGIAEDIAGLIGNTSSLLNALTQLTRTTAGIGIFLSILGLAMMGIACYIAFQIFQAQP